MRAILTSQGISRTFASRELQLIQEVSMTRVVALLAIGTIIYIAGLAGVLTLAFGVGLRSDPVVLGLFGLFVVMTTSFPGWVRWANRVADRVF